MKDDWLTEVNRGGFDKPSPKQTSATAKSLPHTHTPWPKYQKELATAGYVMSFIGDVMSGLKNSPLAFDCPACKQEAGSDNE